MAFDGSPGTEASTSVERVQANSLLGSPFLLVPALLLILAFVASQLLSSDDARQNVTPVPTTFPVVQPTVPYQDLGELAVLLDLGLDGAVAYAIDGGVGVMDLATGGIDEVTAMSDLVVPGDFAVLATDSGYFVINQFEPTNVGLSEIQGDLVSTSQAQRFVAVLFGGVTGGDPEIDVRYAYTLTGSYGVVATDIGLVSTGEIDRDAKHFLVPGLGAVFERSDGGTFVFDANGYREISRHRVVAASATARVEVRCNGETECVPYLVEGEVEFELPALFGRDVELSMSPDGHWILLNVLQPPPGPTSLWEGSGSQLYDVTARQLHPLGVTRPGPPYWAGDSSFVGWLGATTDSTELVITQVEDRSWATIDLTLLGAPERAGDELVFVRG